MTDQSIFNRFRANDAPYVAFQDDNEDHEEESNSYVLRPTIQNTRTRTPLFQPLSNQKQQRYHQLPENDDEELAFSDQESNEAPPSLIVEMPSQRHKKLNPKPGMDIRELTMWKWVNVENLDLFLAHVYSYYIGKGIYCILLSRFLNLLTIGFVLGFSTFLLGCVDYSLVRSSDSLSRVIIPSCIGQLSGWTKLFLVLVTCIWIWTIVRFVLDIRGLIDMYNFYTYLLDIPDADMQTISWQEVVSRIIKIRDNNPNTSHQINSRPQQRLDAHNITNRIMRQDNYLIALFNKDLLNLTIPIPFLRKQNFLTKTMEWNLNWCVMNYVFNDHGQIRKRFIKDVQREKLIHGLRNRIIFMGILNFVSAPFIVVYLLVFFFFRYFEEYRSDPGSIFGSRQWTQFARWKFREFNELSHLFHQRLDKSYKPANKYIDQFPKAKTILFIRFILFIIGSFTAVLILATYIDPDLFLGFEITTGRTVFFYTGVLVPLFAVSRGMIPDDHLVFDPEARLKKVVEHTHYSPDEWRGRLHTDEVRREFIQLFEVKVVLYIQEIFSVIFTPFILWFSLADSFGVQQIIDFFREFTVHVDGVGDVCSFAIFDFRKHGNVKYGAPASEVENEYYLSKDGKMEKSFLNFKANHPDWEPTDPFGSLYLSRLTEFNNQAHPERPNAARTSVVDSILKTTNNNNKRNSNNNVHFSYPIGSQSTTHYTNAGIGGGGGGDDLNSIMEDGQTHAGPSHITRGSYRGYGISNPPSSPLNSPRSSQEHYTSELGDSFILPGARIGGAGINESNEHDKPRNGGVIGLLNQFYELNNSSM
ncbi:autophagy protein Apg9-domain-containing protein [Rhizophagus irregularis DAOM 181602=DAOM 197198]|uniref:Autophagy-related protein 9 n=1 Tax=Rhizophagus irregularis (strain DAOM 181602 / DAOM 197198 / MUCL 43194) TaxID=747089 RepID=A0A2P4QRT4_RHIID|nr:autophagy protein Apg9-domain-containing protein [Rhizophagus irregularis DAOM 181602=DAOM 197198]POG80356.1 autophagy protein Apg9-domain-containing protein [Rhizophagus irregularis DAOM 181602=DAOM 197198]|eukprot:XP_025187222.1 autophagy protein Apg9-domain-containing protein [Rhizophagus irregularis DAOM 181602=DAOM 197198]